jgi:hypothetical protein
MKMSSNKPVSCLSTKSTPTKVAGTTVYKATIPVYCRVINSVGLMSNGGTHSRGVLSRHTLQFHKPPESIILVYSGVMKLQLVDHPIKKRKDR